MTKHLKNGGKNHKLQSTRNPENERREMCNKLQHEGTLFDKNNVSTQNRTEFIMQN
jgi:hypothetical protein